MDSNLSEKIQKRPMENFSSWVCLYVSPVFSLPVDHPNIEQKL